MSYSCLEELQVDLDLHTLDKISVLSNIGCQCNKGWFVITNDGYCHLFDRDGNLDDIKKIKQLEEKHIRKDITKIIIPNSVTSIRSCTFWDCSLTNVMIGNGVTRIGPYAFDGCWDLMSVTISNNIKSIGKRAFAWCRGLRSMTIPNSVTRIGYAAFIHCNCLTNLTFKGKTLEQVKKMKNYPWKIEDESIIKVE